MTGGELSNTTIDFEIIYDTKVGNGHNGAAFPTIYMLRVLQDGDQLFPCHPPQRNPMYIKSHNLHSQLVYPVCSYHWLHQQTDKRSPESCCTHGRDPASGHSRLIPFMYTESEYCGSSHRVNHHNVFPQDAQWVNGWLLHSKLIHHLPGVHHGQQQVILTIINKNKRWNETGKLHFPD